MRKDPFKAAIAKLDRKAKLLELPNNAHETAEEVIAAALTNWENEASQTLVNLLKEKLTAAEPERRAQAVHLRTQYNAPGLNDEERSILRQELIALGILHPVLLLILCRSNIARFGYDHAMSMYLPPAVQAIVKNEGAHSLAWMIEPLYSLFKETQNSEMYWTYALLQSPSQDAVDDLKSLAGGTAPQTIAKQAAIEILICWAKNSPRDSDVRRDLLNWLEENALLIDYPGNVLAPFVEELSPPLLERFESIFYGKQRHKNKYMIAQILMERGNEDAKNYLMRWHPDKI